jgi:hypothetical protein
MRETLRALFAPLLRLFESGDGPYSYRPSHRTILLAVGALFLLLASLSLLAAIAAAQAFAFFPFLIFLAGSVVCLVVGGLGSDRAVAKIWGNR